MNAKSEKLAKILEAAKINTRGVMVLGGTAHIDSFKKYHDALVHLMTSAGFRVLKISEGHHMDGTEGYRASFQVAA